MNRPSRRFAFRLCLAGVGGFVHPDQLLQVMTSKQLAEWMAYAAIEPFGERNRDLSIGILTSVVGNANRDPKKKKTPFIATDFMPLSAVTLMQRKAPLVQPKEEILTIFRGIRDEQRKGAQDG